MARHTIDIASLPTPASSGDRAFCQAMLPHVSRTFAACIRLLPSPVDHQVLVAYLLCRIADTVEDTADLPVEDKERLLARFAECLEDENADTTPLAETFAQPRIPDELLTRECAGVRPRAGGVRGDPPLGPGDGARDGAIRPRSPRGPARAPGVPNLGR